MKNFQIILLGVFGAFVIFGILVFSGTIKIGDQSQEEGSGGTVVLWGTFKRESLFKALDDFNKANKTFTVKYEQKDPATFDQDLLEALASGVGPDLFFMADNLIKRYSNRIYVIPYESYPIASFKSMFAGAGEVFMTSKGILAFPISVDPMVMYYNRMILDANNIIYPPAYWDEFIDLAPRLTKKDESRQISQSAIAMGQFSNINNAKDLISALFMQTGNPIITETADGLFFPTLSSISSSLYGLNSQELGPILNFYTDFSDPLKNVYSWNRSLPNSIDFFSANKLAFYFGFASELQTLVNKNPNQNFLAAPMPQIRNANLRLTSARVTGIAVSSFSKNFNSAFTAASLMTTGDFANDFAKSLSLVPIRRDLLSTKQTDAFFPIFYSSALVSKSWLDPSPKDTDIIFKGMVERVLSNISSPRDSVEDASSKMNLLLNR